MNIFNDSLSVENILAGMESVRGDHFSEIIERTQTPEQLAEGRSHTLVSDLAVEGELPAEAVDPVTLSEAVANGTVKVEGEVSSTPVAQTIVGDNEQLDAGMESVMGSLRQFFGDVSDRSKGRKLSDTRTDAPKASSVLESRIKAIEAELGRAKSEEPSSDTFKLGDARALHLAVLRDRTSYCETAEQVLEHIAKTNAFAETYLDKIGDSIVKSTNRVMDLVSLISSHIDSFDELVKFNNDIIALSKDIIKPYDALVKRPLAITLKNGATIEARASDPIAGGTVLVTGTNNLGIRIVGMWDAAIEKGVLNAAKKQKFDVASKELIGELVGEARRAGEIINRFIVINSHMARINRRAEIINDMLASIYGATESLNTKVQLSNILSSYYSLSYSLWATHHSILETTVDAAALGTSYSMLSASRYR